MGARAGCFVSMALTLGDGTRENHGAGGPKQGGATPTPFPGAVRDNLLTASPDAGHADWS